MNLPVMAQDESGGLRHVRLQGLLLEELRSLLRDDVTDDALADVSITALVLSVDYRHARVHYAVKGANAERERKGIERAFARATPFFRARLAEAIEMKRIPDLRFVFDAAVASDEKD